MKEEAVELIIQRDREQYPDAKPRITSDNDPQFMANDFKSFIRLCGMAHVRTSPYYPQSNGKIERWHKSLKSECVRPHSAIGYISPQNKLDGKEDEVFQAHDEKLAAARELRRKKRQQSRASEPVLNHSNQKLIPLC